MRTARDDELPAVGALTVDGYDADGYLARPGGGYDDGYAAWLGDAASRAADGGLLVAVEGDALLGTVTWCPYGTASAQLASQPHQGELRTLSVAPSARGRGVARALVAACLGRARDAGISEVLLCSLTAMRPAHALYTSIGFTRRPELDWSPDPGVHLLAFSLDLR